MRPRRQVRPAVARVLPLLGFRYSRKRDAYVLRGVGRKVGPALTRSDRPTPDYVREHADWYR